MPHSTDATLPNMAKAARKKPATRKNTREALEEHRKRRHEIIGLACIAVGLVVFFSLLSYNHRDRSWGNATASTSVANWIGPLGAQLSSLLYQAFGYTALFLPVIFFFSAYWLIRYARIPFSWLKATGLCVVLVAVTGLLSIIDWSQDASFHWGGWIGQLMVYEPDYGLASTLHNIGATIVLMLALITGLMMATPLSLVGLVLHFTDKEREAGILATFSERASLWWQQRREARLAELEEEEEEDEVAPANSKSKIKIAKPEKPAVVQEEKPVIKSAGQDSRGTAAAVARKPVENLLADEEAEEDIAEGGEGEEDESQSLTQGQRTVLEMVATASVSRPELHEEKAAVPVRPATEPRNEDYKLPGSDLLVPPSPRSEIADDELKERAIQLAEKCREFNVSGQVKQISPGPVVTTFEFKPDPGVKYSRITGLVDDLCLGMKAESIRIDRLPGKSTVGIEVPNARRETIRLREVVESSKFVESGSKLSLALGKTIDGANYVADLAKMPHLLIAGATGAGKSVALNSILVSILYKARPDEVKMILVDPKRLELGLYADIPHLLTPIVTDPKRASYSLRWAVSEMENRYKHLATFGVRNIDQYNAEVSAIEGRIKPGGIEEVPERLPYIVVVIDELADLMMVAARDVEESITRLAQMARAVGIHLVLATQRPSVDVITGLIKANFPSRISFRVSSKVDSRTIIDANGAEGLLGQGDMLFLPPGTARLVRVHGAYVDEKEVKRICDVARAQSKPSYDEKIVMSEKEAEGEDINIDTRRDEKYEEAVRIVIEMGRASTSVLQRRLRIGYGRAASIIDMMYREGIVGPEDGSKPRQVLVKADFLERLDQLHDEETPW